MIKIVDSIMGSGKTSAAINHINSAGKDYKFIYAAPYLSEVERIIQSCGALEPMQPRDKPTKLANAKSLLQRGKNICTTHALLSLLDDEALKMIADQGYALILDETISVIDEVALSVHDQKAIREYHAELTDDSKLRWKDENYTGRLEDLMMLSDRGCLYKARNGKLMSLLPNNIFTAFREVHVLTYMFAAQTMRYYLDYHDMQYEYLRAKKVSGEYTFAPWQEYVPTASMRRRIRMLENDKMNRIGMNYAALSLNHYSKGNSEHQITETLRKHCGNYFKNIVGARSHETLWTTFKDYRHMISDKGYAKSFLSCNARATNERRDARAIAYLVNRFPNPNVAHFFEQKGAAFDKDSYALAEMIQFIWRSAIRDGKAIDVYIPSSRMRKLLYNWLEKGR